MESNIETLPVIPAIFIKNTLSESKEYTDLTEKILFFADYHSFDYEYTRYIFMLNILKNNLFFEMNENLRENLLYESTFWASLNECRKKIKPTSHDDFSEDKKNAFFTKLQTEVFKAVIKTKDINSPSFDIMLNKYILFFFDLSCIKRDRRDKTSKQKD